MRQVISALFLCSLMGVLSSCGGGAKPPAKAETPPPPPTQPARKGLGLNQAQLLKGITEIKLEPLEGMKNTYKADTSDSADNASQKAALIAYGTEEQVNRAYFTAAIPVTDDPAQYPGYAARNAKLRDTLIANIFGGKVPEAAAKAIAEAKDGKERFAEIDGISVKVKYNPADKSLTVDIK